jgi:hypothetical protein
MKKVIPSLFLVLVLALACGGERGPAETVDAFLQALRDVDKEGALMVIYSGNVDTDIQELFHEMWGDVESGAFSVEEWTEPVVVETEEVKEEGVDILELARVETEVTVKDEGGAETEKVAFEVARNEYGWFVFGMEG